MKIAMGEDDEMFFDYPDPAFWKTTCQKAGYGTGAFGGEKVLQELTGAEESIRLYMGGAEYLDDEAEVYYHPEGRVWLADGQPRFQYKITDHLGNLVVLFEDKDNDGIIVTESMTTDPEEVEVLQRHLYYPFGLHFEGNWTDPQDGDNPYRYNGKEQVNKLGLGWYAYGFRYYDPAIGRFPSVDPLADIPENVSWSPYAYTWNNPIIHTDPDGRSGESIHKDKDGNIIAEIDDGDNNVYVHNDIGNGQHIDGQIALLRGKREYYGTGGGGKVDKIESLKNKFSKLFEEGGQQQHSGENWYIYGKGSQHGWSIKAPKPDPDGVNKSIDISDMQTPGKFSKKNLPARVGGFIETGFIENVEDAIKRINNTEVGQKKVCTLCGDTLDIDAPKGYHTGFDTIKVEQQ
jgi:RHS repeat-associated protein